MERVYSDKDTLELMTAIQNRISVRRFSGEPVQKEQLDRILEAGIRAPSAKNRQPWRFIVVRDDQRREKLMEAAFGQEHVGQAPIVIAACTTNIDYRMPNGQLSYPIDISIAVSFMMLQAVHEGFGTCIVTTFDEADIKHILTVPHSMRVVMLLLIGQAEGESEPTDRMARNRIVGYDHW